MFSSLGKQKGLIFFGVVAFLVIAVVILIACLNNGSPTTGQEILASVPTIIGKSGWSYVIRSNATVANNVNSMTGDPWDFSGLTASSVKAQFYSVGAAGCDAQYKDAVAQTLDQIDLMHRVFQRYEPYFVPATSAKDIYAASESKRIAGFLALDGGYALDSRMSVLRDYYRSTSPVVESANPNELASDGYLNRTTFGEKIISEMNRLGMLIDLTGTTKDTQMEAIRTSLAPVVFTSSASNSVTNHPLNVADDVLLELSARGGIIMIPFNSDQVCSDVLNCTVDDIIAHIEHIWEVTNSKSVIGLGGDVGMVNVGDRSLEYPDGFNNSSAFVTLFNKLLENGNWTVSDLQHLASNNFMRVLRDVEKVARESNNRAPTEVAINLNDIPLNDKGCYTDDGSLAQAGGTRMASVIDNFHDRLYSFQESTPAAEGSPTTGHPDGSSTTTNPTPGTGTPNTATGGTGTPTVAPTTEKATTQHNAGSATITAGCIVLIMQLLIAVS